MTTAKYLIITLVLISSIYTNLNAQVNIEIDSIFTKVIDSDDITAHNTFTNDYQQTDNFRWTRTMIENTEGWTYGVCDNILCYAPFVDVSELELEPGAKSILDVHLYPNMIFSGISMVELKVEALSDPTSAEYAYYIFDSRITSTSNPIKLDFEIYPNPSQGLFTFSLDSEKAAQLIVFDIFGKLIEQMTIGQNQLVNLTNLESGTYLFQLNNEDGQLSETKLITKI